MRVWRSPGTLPMAPGGPQSRKRSPTVTAPSSLPSWHLSIIPQSLNDKISAYLLVLLNHSLLLLSSTFLYCLLELSFCHQPPPSHDPVPFHILFGKLHLLKKSPVSKPHPPPQSLQQLVPLALAEQEAGSVLVVPYDWLRLCSHRKPPSSKKSLHFTWCFSPCPVETPSAISVHRMPFQPD